MYRTVFRVFLAVALLGAAAPLSPAQDLPVLSALSPQDVLPDEMTFVQVHGANFAADTLARVEGVGDLLGQSVQSADLIVGYTPPLDPNNADQSTGWKNVTAYDSRGSTTLQHAVLYVDYGVPYLKSLFPNEAGPDGGTVIQFLGRNLHPGLFPALEGNFCADVVYVSDTRIDAAAPPLTPRPGQPYTAELWNDPEEMVAERPNALSVYAPIFIVAVDPTVVSTRGGDIVTVTTDVPHLGLTPQVGAIPLVNAETVDATTIRGETPPLKPGEYEVTMVTPGGMILGGHDGPIQAVPPQDIAITSVTPLEVSTLGGAILEIGGLGFATDLEPRIGGAPLSEIEVVSDSLIRGITPPLPEGPQDVSLALLGSTVATFGESVNAVTPPLPEGFFMGSPSRFRFSSAGGERITLPIAFIPGDPVFPIFRIGGVAVLPAEPLDPCGVSANPPNQGLNAKAATGTADFSVLEGFVPPLPPGIYRADLYVDGFGAIAGIENPIVIVPPGSPPAVRRIVSAPVLRDGSTRLFILGEDFGPGSKVFIGGLPLGSPQIVSDRLIVGNAPALPPGDSLGTRDLELHDPRGMTTFPVAVEYSPGARFVRGDANASGRVNLADSLAIVAYLFVPKCAPLPCLAAADADGSGRIDLADPVYLIRFLFACGQAPPAPFPSCGIDPGGRLTCASFTPCGVGAGAGPDTTPGTPSTGPAARFFSNVKTLSESPANRLDPRVVDLSTVAGQVSLIDPPGGVDVVPGDVIVGYTPLASRAIQDGVAYMLKVIEQVQDSCIARTAAEKVFRVRSATLIEVFRDLHLASGVSFAGTETSIGISEVRRFKCDIFSPVNTGAAALPAGAQKAAGDISPLIDVDFGGFDVINLQSGNSTLEAGFYRLKVLYGAGGASIGVGISGGGLDHVSFFSGIILDTLIDAFIDLHIDEVFKKEVKLPVTLRRDFLMLTPVPILFTVSGNLYAGIDSQILLDMYLDSGAQASYKAGLGFQFDGSRIANLSGVDPPTIGPAPDTPYFDLNGSGSIKAYVRPEINFFAGLLIKAVTADLAIRSELYTTLHAAGSNHPPCFDWGVDVGLNVVMNPEIQLFGYDLFDHTFDVVRVEATDVLGGQIGCWYPPVAILNFTTEAIPGSDHYLVHFDASKSYDPDGGPVSFRWDFNNDGYCDLPTVSPYVTYERVPECILLPGSHCFSAFYTTVTVTDDEGVTAKRRVLVTKPQ
jgi:hypothetical protein